MAFLSTYYYVFTTMIYAYIRVSTETQSYDGQQYEIQNYCRQNSLTVDRWVEENVSGTKSIEKRTLGRLLKRMKKGDLLLCTELSRLGRNMMMVMSILNSCTAKGVHVHSIKDNFDLSNDLNAKIIAFAFSLAAEIERNLISQRTKEALAAKKSAGVKLGRPQGPSLKHKMFNDRREEVEKMIEKGISKKAVAKHLGVHINTLYRYFRDDLQKNNKNF